MTCALISSKERKREFVFFKSSKDIIVVTISVHSNRSEIQKAGGGAGGEDKVVEYTAIETEIHTHIAACPTPPTK